MSQDQQNTPRPTPARYAGGVAILSAVFGSVGGGVAACIYGASRLAGHPVDLSTSLGIGAAASAAIGLMLQFEDYLRNAPGYVRDANDCDLSLRPEDGFDNKLKAYKAVAACIAAGTLISTTGLGLAAYFTRQGNPEKTAAVSFSTPVAGQTSLYAPRPSTTLP